MKRFTLLSLLLLASTSTFLLAQNPPQPAAPAKLSWGDQGDGTYKNPILKADFSDPDVIRVGSDFYLIASDFQYVGMQILHSKDLIHWEVLGQIFNKLTMSPIYDQMNGYAKGTWAPAIRYHNHEFYIYVCTPEGLYMWHAKNPAGPWSDTITVNNAPRWEDPCPFWDDDGNAYLVHSLQGAGPLILHKMSEDGTKLLDDGKEIYRGPVAEGPKFYKRHGYYYISLPEGGVETGGQVMIRAKDIYGPYEKKQVLENGAPHQGGLIDLDNGESWFFAFKSVGWLGRVVNLEPVTWGNDDWPTFGDNGKHVLQHKVPSLPMLAMSDGVLYLAASAASDEFDANKLNPIWQWNHNPVNENWSLTDSPGNLRLKATPAPSLTMAHNTLTQKLWDDFGLIDVKLSTKNMTDDQRAGITFESGNLFGWIGVEQKQGVRHIATQAGGDTRGGRFGAPPAPVPPTAPFESPDIRDIVYLRATYEQSGAAHFAFSLDNKTFTPVPGTTTLRFNSWKGARIGLFSFGPTPGAADFDSFHYRCFSTKEDLAAATAP